MEQKKVLLRCDDGAEAAVFTKYNFYTESNKVNDFSYEFCIEDDYTGGDYKGFFGRLKRAWRAFWDKPVIYTGIYTEDKKKMRQFLVDCLKVLDGVYETPAYMVVLDDSVTSNEDLIKNGEW